MEDLNMNNVANNNEQVDLEINTEKSGQSTNSMEEKSVGSAIGIIIIVIILLLGGFYFWGQKTDQNKVDEIMDTPVEETADIEADLGGIDTTTVDADLNNIDAELNI